MQSSGFRSRKDGDNFLKQQYKSGENRRESGELRALRGGSGAMNTYYRPQ
jgi:hypothetical protein